MQTEGFVPQASRWLSLSASELASATGGSWSVPMWNGWRFRGFSLSSRRVRPGDLIIQGDADDGFTYGWTASEIVHSRIYPIGVFAKRGSEVHDASIPRLEVDSLEDAIRQLASYTISQFHGVQIAVTGSVGKTTTCKMLEAVLSDNGACLINGQQNLISGVLAATASLTYQHFAVLEVAASAIPKSVPLLKPDICVITQIANAHTQQLIDLRGVAERKGNLLRSQEAGSVAILNRDMPHFDDIRAIARDRRLEVITFGRSEASDYRLIDYDLASGSMHVEVNGRELRYSLRNRGEHIAVNALAVLAVSDQIGLSQDAVARGLRSARPVPGRGDEHFLKDADSERVIRLVNSAYNANETSVIASLERLSEEPTTKAARRIAVLGDMLELGSATQSAHRRVGQAVAASSIDTAIFVGQHYQQVLGRIQGKQTVRAGSPEEAARALHELASDGDTVLLQASNGTGLHKIPAILRAPPFNWERDRINTNSLGPAWAVSSPDGVGSWCGERRVNPGRLARLLGVAVLAEEEGVYGTAMRDALLTHHDLLTDANALSAVAQKAGIDEPALGGLATVLAARLGMSSTVVSDPATARGRNRSTVTDLAVLGRHLADSHPDLASVILPMDRRGFRLYSLGYRGLIVAGSPRIGFHAVSLLPSAHGSRALVVGQAESAAQCIDILSHLAIHGAA